MRRWTMTVVLAVLLTAGGCGGSDDPAATDVDDLEAIGDVEAIDDETSGGVFGTTVPECPLDDDQVVEIAGRPMIADGNCLWRDEQGVALLQISLASELAGSTTGDFAREDGEARFGNVSDVAAGDLSGFVAVDDLSGTASVSGPPGSFTVQISSFSEVTADNEALLRALVSAIGG